MRLKNKVAIITGAASGMGPPTAKVFANEGAKVIVTDIATQEAAALAEEIVAAGDEAGFLKLDVANEADWARAVGETNSVYGQIDILINNAGISGSHPDRLNIGIWDEQMNIYARGAFLGTQAVVPIMQRAGVRVVDTETGSDQPPGVPGELWICGYSVMSRYYKKPDETVASLDQDGWFYAGDMGNGPTRAICVFWAVSKMC